MELEWNFIQVKSPEYLQIKTNLTCGQAFRWRFYDNTSVIGVFEHRVWQLKQEDSSLCYRVLACPHWQYNENVKSKSVASKGKRKFDQGDGQQLRGCDCQHQEESLLQDYFNLKVDLKKLFTQWKKKDKRFSQMSAKFSGIRVLRQNPVETLLSFICTVNNNISRIIFMIESMCQNYGEKLLNFDGVSYYDFPTLERLSREDTNKGLRDLGFGYRAPFIGKCANEVLQNGGEKWLNSLRNQSYDTAVTELIKLPGVGMKVADCVCLMALDKLEAVPIDTHVRQIAEREYNYKIKAKSLTNKIYKDLGEYFRTLWGPYAGWTQAVLFAGEIKDLLPIYSLSHDKIPEKKSKKNA